MAAMIGIGTMAASPASEAASREEIAKISVNKQGTNFKYWNKDAASYKALTGYVKDITDKRSKNFIPVEDRIAVFDVDGTLACETAPFCFDFMMFIHRALDDSNYTASAQDRENAEAVKNAIYNGKKFEKTTYDSSTGARYYTMISPLIKSSNNNSTVVGVVYTRANLDSVYDSINSIIWSNL